MLHGTIAREFLSVWNQTAVAPSANRRRQWGPSGINAVFIWRYLVRVICMLVSDQQYILTPKTDTTTPEWHLLITTRAWGRHLSRCPLTYDLRVHSGTYFALQPILNYSWHINRKAWPISSTSLMTQEPALRNKLQQLTPLQYAKSINEYVT